MLTTSKLKYDEKKDIYIVYPFTNYTLITKWKVVDFTIGKPGGHHQSHVIMLISPVLRQTNIMWLLMWCSEYNNVASVIFLPKMYSLMLKMKKHETNSCWDKMDKITGLHSSKISNLRETKAKELVRLKGGQKGINKCLSL